MAPSQLMEANSAARALNIVGDRWTLMILGYAFARVRRFEDFHGRIGIARSLLTDRLRRLEDAGIMRRELYSDHSARHEYRLTEMGRDLFGPAMMIIRWEKRWFYDKRIAAHRIMHTCGKTFTPECRCKACGQLVEWRDVRATPGPGAGIDPPQAPRAQRRSIVENASPEQAMIERSVDVLGDRWTAHTIAAAFMGRKRFVEFQRALGVATNILADRLARLVELGVLDQRLYQQNPERWEYRLSARGRDLFPLIVELVRWGDKWLAGGKGAPMILHHSCGKVLNPLLTCDQCEKPIAPDSTNVAAG
jgi:DNA-binding HxlR family transcriptional regulator